MIEIKPGGSPFRRPKFGDGGTPSLPKIMPEEIFDVVNERDEVIDQKPRSAPCFALRISKARMASGVSRNILFRSWLSSGSLSSEAFAPIENS